MLLLLRGDTGRTHIFFLVFIDVAAVTTRFGPELRPASTTKSVALRGAHRIRYGIVFWLTHQPTVGCPQARGLRTYGMRFLQPHRRV